MRLLAMVAALTLALPGPVAGAPSLASSGCPLFPAGNVWHADVSRLPVPAGLLPKVLTVILGLTAAALAFRSLRRTHSRDSRRR
jgi:hypothetical protein